MTRIAPLRVSYRGFTLIEVLVAIVIFAIVGVLAMGGYNQLLDQTTHTRANMERVRSLQKAMLRITQDFAELEPRPVREASGTQVQPCLIADGRDQYIAQLTRAGWGNPAGIQRSTLQRVGYRLDKDKLIREYWPMLDRVLAVEPISVVLLDRIDNVKLRFLDTQLVWQDRWPANGSNATQVGTAANALSAEQRPLAVEITVELQDWGKIVRIIEVSG